MISVRSAIVEDGKLTYELALNFPSPTEIDRETFFETWNEKLNDEKSLTYVVESAGELIGYAAGYMHRPFYANGSTFWLDEILIKDEYRKEGIGSKLMSEIEAWAKNRGCKQMLLASSNMGNFYETLGFKSTAEYFKKYL